MQRLPTVPTRPQLVSENLILHAAQLRRASIPFLAALMVAFNATAANILDNANFESGWASWTPTSPVNWNYYVENQSPNHSGSRVFKAFGCWCGDTNYCTIQQDNSASPGNTYTASGWMFTRSTDHTANYGWFEVRFLDAGGNTLEVYQSARLKTLDPQDTWLFYTVTNKMDLTGNTNIGSASTLAAPAGTAKVRFLVVHQQLAGGGGAIHYDDVVLDQLTGNRPPAIANISPNDVVALFAPASAGFTFNATSATTNISASGISVIVNGAEVSSSLAVSGSGGNRSIAYNGLKTNRVYTAAVTVTDDAGYVKTASVIFDTFDANNLMWEAEDYDYGGGNYINNSILSTNSVSSYYGKAGTADVDWHESGSPDGGHSYRLDLGPGTEVCGDTARPQFAAAGGETNGVFDYNVGWTYNNGTSWSGDWANYTRSFPSNIYNIYGRLSGGGGSSKVAVWEVTSGVGTPSQTVNKLGEFHFNSHGWQAYDFVPLSDDNGNLVAVQLNGVKTLRIAGDNANHNFFMVAPARDDLPQINNLYPTGTHPFEPTNTLAFNARSLVATIPTANIHVTLDGVDVSSKLVIGGSATNRTVVLPLLSMNAMHTATISVTDSAGTPLVRTLSFDTFSESSIMFEAEDYDFNNGQFITSPVLSTTPGANNYFGLSTPATEGVDISTNLPSSGYHSDYGRPDIVGTEVTLDYLRQAYVTAQGTDPGVKDYNVGWWTSGAWMNYTRNFPAGNYAIYGRLASPSVVGATIARVTAGAGTPTQTLAPIGAFTGSSLGWQTWIWTPVLKPDGSLATVSLSGVNTLRVNNTTGNVNANFVMFVPAKSSVVLNVSRGGGTTTLSWPSQSGATYTIQYKNSLSDANWSALTTVLGDGSTKTATDSSGGGTRFYRALIQ